MTDLDPLRAHIREMTLADEAATLAPLLAATRLSPDLRARAAIRAADLVHRIRHDARPGLMEVFLAEYGLSTEEGVALMCLAEALLRTPDAASIDALIEDKIAPSDWGAHLGHASSSLVNAATWGLMLTGRVLREREDGLAATLQGAVRRLGEPVIRVAVGRAMREMGAQFVLGETIDAALRRGRAQEKKGYTYSYDMLGEAAMTAADSAEFYAAYEGAIARLAPECTASSVRDNPGISVKLSALHPRYETAKRARVLSELVPRVTALARQARAAGMGFNIDAEEADRLDLSLDVIAAVLPDPHLAGWDGFGVVVQAYGQRAAPVIDWLQALAERLDRQIMVRLVKGAYWDTEIKRAQVAGIDGFPVLTRKAATDVHFLLCAEKLLAADRIYPQFATHNAHTVAAILEIAPKADEYEFQRLHGMGAVLHDLVLADADTRCRIYAPVGAHKDLLAYLVRRLLENGANSSFVNQIVDTSVPPSVVAADPFEALARGGSNAAVVQPPDLFRPERPNSRGWNPADPVDLAWLEAARAPWRQHRWTAGPMLAAPHAASPPVTLCNPADPDDTVGTVTWADAGTVDAALAVARPWAAPVAERARVLNAAADALEARAGEIFALVAREAGKTLPDAIAELREAVDFLRYYAARALELDAPPRGRLACISPWNFPLAIFTGQVAAGLAAGNAVLAKPAEETPLTAALATECLLQAGVPAAALQLLPGDGSVGAALTADARVDGVTFTGGTDTAQAIHRSMADHLDPAAPLVAETGGLNAMIVDSTALPEQAVRDILASAFQSAGQRCSALRILYVQEDVAETLLTLLEGAMDELAVGDPWEVASDVGPAISAGARAGIADHIATAAAEGRVRKALPAPSEGHFVGPALVEVSGIDALAREVFGPVLHVARYRAEDLERVIEAINAKGYGLTFGIHSRIDDRVEAACAAIAAGNVYVNRNQIGAIVGSQPFGGEGLSGTGPKAGGPAYVRRFTAGRQPRRQGPETGPAHPADLVQVQAAIDRAAVSAATLSARELPGPTGESNRLTTLGRGVVLCLGPTAEDAAAQADAAKSAGCSAVRVAPGARGPGAVDGRLDPDALSALQGMAAVVLWSAPGEARAARRALALRDGPILPLIVEDAVAERCVLERHVCIDTTAAGGNAGLLAAASV